MIIARQIIIFNVKTPSFASLHIYTYIYIYIYIYTRTRRAHASRARVARTRRAHASRARVNARPPEVIYICK